MINKIAMINDYLKRNGITNTEFARHIGYNRVSWQKIKSGIVPTSERFINNVKNVYPDIFLQPNDTNVVNKQNTPLPLRARISRALGRFKDKFLELLPSGAKKPTRGETMVFEIKADWQSVKKHGLVNAFWELCPGLPRFYNGDRVEITYSLNIEYFGNAVRDLEAIIKAIDSKEIVVSCDTKELAHSRCVIQELFIKAEQIERKFN